GGGIALRYAAKAFPCSPLGSGLGRPEWPLGVGGVDGVGMAVYHLPRSVLAPEGGGGSEDPAGHRAAAYADYPVLHLVDRGQVGRNVARQAIVARQLAIAESRRGVLQACRD